MCQCSLNVLNTHHRLTVFQCSALLQTLPGKLFSPTHLPSNYTQANSNRWAANAVLAPACIIQPVNAADVSAAIKILTSNPSSGLLACPFSIKSGGHTAFPGANNIDDGISIDLTKLRGIEVSADKRVVSLGPGNTWMAVAKALEGTGIRVPGGRCGGTGVGGVALGGGISFFAPSVGFVADNILNYEVVLANSSIVNANKTSNSDLWLALKGGGSNFGIVTRFDIASFSLSTMWGGALPLPDSPQTTPLVLSALHNFTAAHAQLPNTTLGILGFYNASIPSGVTWTSLLHFGPSLSDLVPVTAALSPTDAPALPFSEVLHETTHYHYLLEMEPFWPRGHRQFISTVTFVNDAATLAGVHKITASLYERVKDVPGLQYLFAYEPVPHSFTTFSQSRAGTANILGLNRTTDDLILMQLVPLWMSPADDKTMHHLSRDWVKEVQAYTQRMGTANEWLYLNYADGFQNPIASYGERSVRFLRSVAIKYDPEGVFQKALRGGFKLPESKDASIVRDEL